MLHLRRHGYIKEYTLKDPNTFRIDEKSKCVFIDIRNIEGEVAAECIVDIDDWDEVKKYKWSLTTKPDPYIFNRQRDRTPLHIYLHRLVLGLSYGDGYIADHINGNTLDNRKENLRIVTSSQNSMNTRISKDNTSGYKGVSYSKAMNKWTVQIFAKGENTVVGHFDDIDKAVEARKREEIRLFGDYSRHYGKASEIDSV